MVHFVLSRRGYEQLVAPTRLPPSPLWVGGSVLSGAELADLRSHGIDLTNFAPDTDLTDKAGISEAIATIQQHHPTSVIWVENGYAA